MGQSYKILTSLGVFVISSKLSVLSKGEESSALALSCLLNTAQSQLRPNGELRQASDSLIEEEE